MKKLWKLWEYANNKPIVAGIIILIIEYFFCIVAKKIPDSIWTLMALIVLNVLLVLFVVVKVVSWFKKKREQTPVGSEMDQKDNSRFVGEYPPDNTPCEVNMPFKKTWTIRNVGQTTWENRYMICTSVPVGLSFNNKIKMKKVKPGEEYTLVVIFTAKIEGIYSIRWKMCDENEKELFPNLFGLGVTFQAMRHDDYIRQNVQLKEY